MTKRKYLLLLRGFLPLRLLPHMASKFNKYLEGKTGNVGLSSLLLLLTADPTIQVSDFGHCSLTSSSQRLLVHLGVVTSAWATIPRAKLIVLLPEWVNGSLLLRLPLISDFCPLVLVASPAF